RGSDPPADPGRAGATLLKRGTKIGAKALALLALLVAALAPLRAGTLEAEVKAAYLLKLGSFVRWPPPAQASAYFRICIVGRADVTQALVRLADGEQVEGKNVAIIRMDLGEL